ncbi:MAG TPA: SpoIID/LytB domain-containing protein, partial [Blastocatellia bacterium]|nr:SpoIID/LytB domain-containing protein [Blastocatellia bacterium]
MHTLFGSARVRLSVALASTILASGCAQSFLFVASAMQKPTADIKTRSNQSGEISRPRTVAAATEKKPAEPIMRILLMTDVSSVALSSGSGLVVSRSSPGARDDKKVASGSIRVELREPSRVAVSHAPVYRIAVETTEDVRHARKLADKLTDKFDEQAAVAYDSKEKEYDVVIGRFASKSDANAMLARIRLSGYADARVVTETTAAEPSAKDSYSKLAKAKSQSESARNDRSTDKSTRTSQLSAFEAGKMIAASDERLVVFPAPAPNKGFDKIDREAIASRDDDSAPDERQASSSRVSAASDNRLAVRVGNNEYRGEIHLVINRRGRISVINAVSMEDYLLGVVPMELPPGPYPAIEALKAQAVAARTYALANRNQHGDDGFDLYDDARSQVYAGLTGERALSNRAVEETRGMVAVFVDQAGHASPIQALYTANCGGRTENNEAVFGGAPLPYLRGVACAPDRATSAERDITTNRIANRSLDLEDRSLL